MYHNYNSHHQQQNQQNKGPSLNDFNFLNKIGEGSYSSVHKVIKKSDGQPYALKKVKLDSLKPKEKENALNEVRILASISHNHIISYKDTFFDERSNSLCLVMEFAEEGDLQRRIDTFAKTRQHFPEPQIWKIFTHCLRGLQVLHGMKILHRDIKCANIFISKEGHYKLGDLNVSKVAKKGLVYTQTGTPYYASPEVWRDEPYDFKSDLWSLGCIIYELCALKPPFRAKNMEGLYQKVQKGVFERIPRQYSDDLYEVIKLCLKVQSAMRPTCKQLLNNPIVKRNTSQFQQETSHQELNTMELENNFNLLNTIKVPKNMRQLQDKLPKNQYAKKEEIQNNSFDNADLSDHAEKRQREPKRGNKIASALPNYDSNGQQRGRSENVRLGQQQQQQPQQSQLPNIYENPSQQQHQQHQQQQQQQQQQLHQQNHNQNPKYYNDPRHNNNPSNGSLPKITNSPYSGQNQGQYRGKQQSNYHYVEGDQSNMYNYNNNNRRRQPSDMSAMESQLQRKERYLMGKNQSQNHMKKYDAYGNSPYNDPMAPSYGYSPKIQVTDSKALNYQQILQQQKRIYEQSNQRLNYLYEKQGYQPSSISHKRSKNTQPFDPILQSQQGMYNQNSQRPVWWG